MTRFTARFPNRQLAVALLGRGAVAWVLVRLLLLVAPQLSGGALIQLEPTAALAVVGLTGFIGLVHARWRNEPRFFANLGIAPAATLLLSMAPAVVAETLMAVLGGG